MEQDAGEEAERPIGQKAGCESCSCRAREQQHDQGEHPTDLAKCVSEKREKRDKTSKQQLRAWRNRVYSCVQTLTYLLDIRLAYRMMVFCSQGLLNA